MGASFRVEMRVNRLPDLAAQTRKKLSQVVRKTTTDLEAQAKVRAPVDTGALRNSIQGTATGELSGQVAVGVEYGAVVELGTSTQPAQPFLGPAAEAVRPGFEAAVAKVLESA